jgi:biotin carboxylase/GNAT superfamily N-acetyltransferase
MTERHVLFLFGPQVCIPEDPLLAARDLGCRTSVLSAASCCAPPSLIDRFEKVDRVEAEDFLRASTAINAAARINAVVCYDDPMVPIAARVIAALGVPGHPIHAADAARDKSQMKQCFAAASLPMAQYALAACEKEAADWATARGYPVVVKPRRGSASQGVIRADNQDQLRQGFQRVLKIVNGSGASSRTDATSVLVESYMPGGEVSVELMVAHGTPHVLCIFEKPEPLEGPYFEETIYISPPRLPEKLCIQLGELAVQACRAIDLQNGPAHCEIRLTPEGPRLLEVAARLIGGACSRVFRYTFNEDIHPVVLKCALGEAFDLPKQGPHCAAGALMLPIPAAGTLKVVRGVDQVQRMKGVRDVIITAQPGQTIVPFPEQSCYVGFVTASGTTTEDVERTLQLAKESIVLELEPTPCQMWECRLDAYSCKDVDAAGISDLSKYAAADARSMAEHLLAQGQFSDLPSDLAIASARHCLQHLEGGQQGRTSTDLWLVSKGRGVILGAQPDEGGFIACLAVLPEFRSAGVGEALVQSLMKRFAAKGQKLVRVQIDPRQPAALSFYQKAGFKRSDESGQTCCCT